MISPGESLEQVYERIALSVFADSVATPTRDSQRGFSDQAREAIGSYLDSGRSVDPELTGSLDRSERVDRTRLYAENEDRRRLPDEFSARGPVDSAGPGLSDRLSANLAKTVDDGLDLGPQR